MQKKESSDKRTMAKWQVSQIYISVSTFILRPNYIEIFLTCKYKCPSLCSCSPKARSDPHSFDGSSAIRGRIQIKTGTGTHTITVNISNPFNELDQGRK